MCSILNNSKCSEPPLALTPGAEPSMINKVRAEKCLESKCLYFCSISDVHRDKRCSKRHNPELCVPCYVGAVGQRWLWLLKGRQLKGSCMGLMKAENHLELCCAMLCCCTVLCHIMLCHAVLSHAMLCWPMLCFAMLCHTTLCCTMWC